MDFAPPLRFLALVFSVSQVTPLAASLRQVNELVT